jgi:hypothetical protein
LFHAASLFSKVVGRSRTNACPNQGLNTLCWFFFQKLLLGQEPMFVHIKCSRLFVGFFPKVVVRSGTNVCPDQVFKTFCWCFFPKVVARSGINACPNQGLNILCWFFFQKLLLG